MPEFKPGDVVQCTEEGGGMWVDHADRIQAYGVYIHPGDVGVVERVFARVVWGDFCIIQMLRQRAKVEVSIRSLATWRRLDTDTC